ncbi:two-component response regulator ARR1-like [Herrania umbratica]|uniref:Two-component response regulator ARR1-like n=1 Tax=Herrania umbratica TaxID=108875 RepID=A0A6J1BIV5_9ROSI|nr:two-component response regulator ARR1-like [Herrania umbratica]
MKELSRSKIPRCSRGLPILLVDHDTTSLMYLAAMLERYSYKVTTTVLPSVAVSMIQQGNNSFKLVMANIDMEDKNSLSFLRALLKKGIPVIVMSSERSENVAQKAIAYGASLHLQKPISFSDLTYLWQHAYRNVKNQAIKFKEVASQSKSAVARNYNFIGIDETNDPKGKNKEVAETDVRIPKTNCVMGLKQTPIEHMLAKENLKHGEPSSETKKSYADKEDKRENKRNKPNPELADFGKAETAKQEGGKDEKNNQSRSPKGKKSRLVWNPELHHKFTAALSALGDENARPKSILQMMNEPTLTHRQVASHLQKYKAQVPRLSTPRTSNLPAVSNACTSKYGKAGLFDMLQKNKSILNHLEHQSADFSIRDSFQFPNLVQDSTAPISSLYQNQQFPMVPQTMNQKLNVTLDSTDPVSSFNLTLQFPSMLPYMNQNLNFTAGSDFTDLPNQTQQFPNVPQFPDVHQFVPQMQNFIPDSTPTSVSLNQGQVFVSSSQPTQGINSTVAQCRAMPDANKFLTEIIGGDSGVDATAHAATPSAPSESQHQHSPELANLLKVLDEESDATRGSGIEPHPGEVDQFCEWLKEAIVDNNENPYLAS